MGALSKRGAHSDPSRRHAAIASEGRATRVEILVLPIVLAGSLLAGALIARLAFETGEWRAGALAALVAAGPLPYLALALRGARGR